MRLRSTRLTAIAHAVRKLLFTPASLFTSGAQGVWYDPSDLTTLYQDSAGTTPVTAVEQPVGLMLDKSNGLALGAELVTNGTFDANINGWTDGAWSSGSASAVSGEMVVVIPSGAAYYRKVTAISVVVGKTYILTGNVRLVSGSGSSLLGVGTSSAGISPEFVASNGRRVFTATAATMYVSAGNPEGSSNGYSLAFDNISVRELPGNHAFQTTAASRPVLSARYNLLTKTEQFDDAAWTKGNATITANAIVAPNGTTTADGFVDNSTNSFHQVVQSTTGVAGAYTASVTVYAGFYNFVLVQLATDATSKRYGAVVNLTTGAVTATSSLGSPVAASNSVTSLGGGWYRISVNATNTSGNVYLTIASVTSGTPTLNGFGLQDYVGGGNTCFYIWGASIVQTAQAPAAYQRVNTSTDYDTVGFKPYLLADGVDDGMVTNSINFTSTDKMTVCAGVRKLSDAAVNMLVELSGAAEANHGAFNMITSNPSGAYKYQNVTNGTLATWAYTTDAAYTAPITNVISGIDDISADSAILRINGAQAASSTGDQGTGNYGNYPLYLFRRGGTTLPFNGRMYQMTIVGKTVTAGELANLETYTNQKTGAY